MTFAVVVLALASMASLVAWIWLITIAFKNGQQSWGIALIVTAFIPFVGPFVALAFIIKYWGIARKPAFVLLGSLCMAGIGSLVLTNHLRSMAQELAENSELQIAIQQAQAAPDERPPTAPDAPSPPPPSVDPYRLASSASRPASLNQPEPQPSAAVENRTVSESPPTLPTIPPALDNGTSPLAIDTLRLGEANPNQMRSVLAQGRNTGNLAIREARLALSYFNDRGLRLGRWITVHSESTNIVPAMTTNQFTIQAFFVPRFTKEVRIEVESIRFANGERWPPIDPTLVKPVVATPP